MRQLQPFKCPPLLPRECPTCLSYGAWADYGVEKSFQYCLCGSIGSQPSSDKLKFKFLVERGGHK